jgi:uncharacterized cupredoxin-like copper-binding protein
MRRTWAIAAVLVTALALAACGSSSGSKSSGDSKSSSTTSGNDSGGVSTDTTTKGTPVVVVVGDTQGTDGPMTMEVAPTTAPAGDVTFTVRNTGTIKHEMVVLKTDTPYDQLAVTAGRVSEKDSVGEVGDVEPGKSGSVTLKLAAGNYVLVCNIKDHYSMGMRAAFTVS